MALIHVLSVLSVDPCDTCHDSRHHSLPEVPQLCSTQRLSHQTFSGKACYSEAVHNPGTATLVAMRKCSTVPFGNFTIASCNSGLCPAA